ncbi:isoprenylcysteine carboxylmethyltransferase family protein [Marinobacter sp. TBZ242]|uniref:Isoprenylcysteine carboxylmethyltransferase family protein n=1 Tax=Marinobacter azerbaijanicus TaxID=3050455 RepID=A0ABT7IER6_9GAMM|nr:isoprenylcysteine carboxylmethyltransferase family protein [Marinobacter sp. TBZ242]MDL0432667.1 isoprenylcysteine carboxylmethyltransferase family protein [Marinobacter sp. TBZ242]
MLEKRIPPLLLVLIIGAAMWGISAPTSPVPMDDTFRRVAAIVIFVVGALFPVLGVVAFLRARTTVDPRTPEASSALVRSGIYRYSRNPMYVGFALWLLAWSVFLGPGWELLGVVFFVLYMNHFQIVPEERALRALFGEEFRAYEQQVRRWL